MASSPGVPPVCFYEACNCMQLVSYITQALVFAIKLEQAGTLQQIVRCVCL